MFCYGLTSSYMPMLGGLNPFGFFNPMMPVMPKYSLNDYNIFGFTPPTNFGYMPWLDNSVKPYNVYPQPISFGSGCYTSPERDYSGCGTFGFLSGNNVSTANSDSSGNIFGFLYGKSKPAKTNTTTTTTTTTTTATNPFSYGASDNTTFGFLTNRQNTYNNGIYGWNYTSQTSSNPVINKAIQLAKSQVGVSETSQNDSKEIRKYKNGSIDSNPWCGSFVSWCYGAGQGRDNTLTFGYDRSSQSIRQKAEQAGCYSTKSSGYTPKVGDLMVLKYGGDSGGHVGMVVAVNSDGTFDTVEGNLSNEVKKVHRSMDTKNLHGFVRMNEWLHA